MRRAADNGGQTMGLWTPGANQPINGVYHLDPALTINGVTVLPTFRYKLGDASAGGLPAWTYGETLSLAGSGDAPSYNQGSPCLGPLDDSCKFNGGKYFQADNNALADITTEDFVFELVVQKGPLGNDRPLAKSPAGGLSQGWLLWSQSNANLAFGLNVGGTFKGIYATQMSLNHWYHLIWFFDRSGSAVCYKNGVIDPEGAVDISTIAATATAANPLTIGAETDGSEPYTSSIGYCALWQRDGWLDTHLQANIAQERFCKLTGFYLQVANGTALPVAARTGRASAAYLEKIENGAVKYCLVGEDWLRVCERKDANGDTLRGYLSEPETTTTINSFTSPHGNWTLDDLTTALSSSDSPLTGTKWTEFTETTATNVHYGRPIATWWAVDPDEYLSWLFFIKPGARRYVEIAIRNEFSGHLAFARVDTNNMSILESGTTNGSSITLEYAAVEGEAGDGYAFRIIAKNPDVAARAFAGYVAGALTDDAFSASAFESYAGSDASAAFSVVNGATVNASTPYYLGPIYAPSSAAVTRAADQLEYKGDDGNLGGVGSDKQGTIKCDVLLPDRTPSTNGYLFNLSDGGSGVQRHSIYYKTNGNLSAYCQADGQSWGDTAGLVDINDGEKHTIKLEWNYSAALGKGSVDGVASYDSASMDAFPDDVDRITIASAADGSQGLNGLISNLRIYNRSGA